MNAGFTFIPHFFEFFGGILVEKQTGLYKETHILLGNFMFSNVISLQPTTVLDSLFTAKITQKGKQPVGPLNISPVVLLLYCALDSP